MHCRWLPSLAVTAQRPEEGSQRPDKPLELHAASSCTLCKRGVAVSGLVSFTFVPFSATIMFVNTSRGVIHFQLVFLHTFYLEDIQIYKIVESVVQ